MTVPSSKKAINILDFGIDALKDYVKEMGQPTFRAEQLIQWIHQKGVLDLDKMTNISQSFKDELSKCSEIALPELALERVSPDGTHKWLLNLSDGNAIETVFIPERGRGTLCVSSQVGCALNCSFCATGKEGFSRNLTLSEIIGQVWVAVHRLLALDKGDYRVTNVVMMGMGEPLLNYQPVVDAMALMLDDRAYGLSKYRVTLSTSGLLPQMNRLKGDSPVSLAVSLHAANDALRNTLVPLNKKYPLRELIQTCKEYYPANSKRVVTFEYVMLEGINDQISHAKELVKLLSTCPAKINLIPFNPFPQTRYTRSSDETIERFRQHLIHAGQNAWTRKTRGGDIDGACGQLAGKVTDRTGRHARWLKTGHLIPIKSNEKA